MVRAHIERRPSQTRRRLLFRSLTQDWPSNKFNRPNTKDLGSGVIGGKECDHFAFRNEEVDWQIWIAQGDQPYPCRYVITSKTIDQAPQYSVQVRDFKAGSEVAADDFAFHDAANAKKIEVVDLGDIDELPSQFKGVAQ
jgi:hypothetical protein